MSVQGILATVIATRLDECLKKDEGKIGPATSEFIRELADAVNPRRNDCRGIPRPGCDYLAACGTVCNKCGQVHSVHLLTALKGSV